MKIVFSFLSLSFISITNATAQETYHEQYRPQTHFSPKEHWEPDKALYLFDKIIPVPKGTK